jgi:hypothetical protein
MLIFRAGTDSTIASSTLTDSRSFDDPESAFPAVYHSAAEADAAPTALSASTTSTTVHTAFRIDLM